MPCQRALVQQVARPLQKRLLRPQRLAGVRGVQQPKPGQSGQEHSGVELRRPLSEAMPIDDAGALPDVQDMAGGGGREEDTARIPSPFYILCPLLLFKKKKK